jgi:hypothetical protein
VLFLVEHRDAIVLGPTTVDGASVAPDGSLYVHSINAATVRVHGAEGSIDAEVLPRVRLWLRWLLMLGLQRNPAGTDAPRETYADRIPPHQGELGLWYEPSRWRLGAFLAARERQDRLNDPINTGDNRIPAEGTPGFLTLHLRAMLRATDEIRVRLALDNLTNELVLEHGNGFYGAGFSGNARRRGGPAVTEASSRAPWVARVARFGGERWGVVAGRAIRLRSVVSCLLLFATALSATSGVALYVRPEGSLATWTGWSLLGLDKQDWEAVHSVAVVFFLLAATWHLVLNWRPSAGPFPHSREAAGQRNAAPCAGACPGAGGGGAAPGGDAPRLARRCVSSPMGAGRSRAPPPPW